MSIEWNAKYATDETKIDDQHRQLFRMANKLESLIEAGDPPRDEIDRLLHFLESYAKTHFQYEENCMHARRCPAAKANRAAHTAFIKFFSDSSDKMRAGDYSLAWLQEINVFLQEWLDSHICQLDTQLRTSAKPD